MATGAGKATWRFQTGVRLDLQATTGDHDTIRYPERFLLPLTLRLKRCCRRGYG
jgi:hypothetical protein